MAADYLESQFGPAVPIPVDIDYLVEYAEGVDLDFYPGLKPNHLIVGGVWRDPDTGALAIYVDEGIGDDDTPNGWAFYRMTVAEELAHIRLHRALIDAVATADDFRKLHNRTDWALIERNAKRFAAAILIPATALASEAGHAYEVIVGQPQSCRAIREGEPSRWIEPVKTHLCNELLRRFQVSRPAMHHRLGEWPERIYERVERSVKAVSDTLV